MSHGIKLISSQSRFGLTQQYFRPIISVFYNFLMNLNGFYEICVKMFLIPRPFCMFHDHSKFKILTDLTQKTPD